MTQNFFVGGVIVSPIVAQLAVALLLTVLVSYVLLRLRFYELVWHRPLVEVSLFCIFLGLLVVFAPDGLPLVAPDAASEPVAR